MACSLLTIMNFGLECLITGLDYWTGILEWTTGLTFSWFYTFLRVGLLYIWVACDNISALSGGYDIADCVTIVNKFF